MMALQTGQDKMARNPLNLCGQKGVLVRRDEEPLEVDITQYAEALQPDILSALEDPSRLGHDELKEVARSVINRGWEDTLYYKTAARVCAIICQKEHEAEKNKEKDSSCAFRNELCVICKVLKDKAAELNAEGLGYWFAFVRFLSQVYSRVKIGGERLKDLSNTLIDCLSLFTLVPAVNRVEEVDQLCSILHEVGIYLEEDSPVKMKQMMRAVYNGYLHPQLEPTCRPILQQVVELHAHSWQLPADIADFYNNYS